MIPGSVQAGNEAQLNGELAEDFTIESKVTLVTLLKDALSKLDSNDGGDAPGVESLASLLVSTDAEIVLLALEVLAAAQTEDGYSSKTMSYVREISYGWPSRDQWFCAKEAARSLYFEFYQDGKLEVIQVEVEELCREDCLDLFNRLVRDFKVPGELRFSLLTRIRFAKAFSSAETRYEYLRISILALGLVPHVEKSQLLDLEAVACDGVVPESVRISALYALGAHGKEDILTTAERDAKVHEFLSGKIQHSSGFIKALLDNSSAPIDLQDEDRKRRRQLPSSVFGVLSLNEALIWLEDELKDISSSDDDSLREKQRMIRDLLSEAFEGGEGEVEQFLVKIFDNPRLLKGTSSSSKVSTDGWKIVEATMSWKLSDELHAKLAKLILDDVTAVPEAVLLKALSASFMSTLVGVGGYEFLRQLPVSVVMKLERFPPTDKCGGYAEMAKSLCEDFGSLIEGKCAEKVEVLPWIVERMLFNNDGHCNAFFFKQLFMSGALDKLLIAFEAFGSCSTPVGSSTTGMAPSLDVYFSIFCQLLDSEWADLTGEEDEKRIKQQIFYAVLRVIRLCDISQFTPRMAAAVLEQLCKKNPAEVDDLAVSKLVSMGYDKAVARAALEKTGDSIERAVEKMAEENLLETSFPPMLEMVDLLLKLMNCHGSEDLILTIWRNGVLHERETALVSLVCQLGSEAAAAKLLALLVTKDTTAAVVIRRRGIANQFLELLLSPKFETSVESAAVVLRLLFGGGDHGGNPFAASVMSEDQHKQAVVWFGNFICQTPPTAHGPKLLKLGETLTRNRKMALELVTNARDLAVLFERLLNLSVNPDSKSCACKTVLHLLEDHQMLYHRMVRAIRARLLANAADVHDFLRDMSSWAFREPAIFLRASFDTCEVVRVGKDQHYIFLKGGQVTGNGGDESALVSTHFLDVFAQLRDPLLARLDDVRIELLTKIYDEFPDFLLGHEAGILDRVLESESKASSVSKFLKAVWRENRDSVLQALMKAFSLELISTSKLVRLSKVLESCYEFLDALLADRIVKALAALDLDHPEAPAVVTSVFEVLANFLSSHRHRPVVSIPPYVSEAGVITFLQAMYATAEDPVAAISTGAEETTQNMWAFLATLDPDLRLQILRTCPDLLPELTQHQQAPDVALQDQAAEHDRHHTEDEHETEEEDQNEDEDDEYANGEDATEDGDGEDDVDEIHGMEEEDDEMQDGLEGDQCEQEQEISPQSWVVDNDDLETLFKFLRFAPESFDERKLVSFLKRHTNHAELARVLVRMLLRTENARAFGSPANGLFHRNFVLGLPCFVLKRLLCLFSELGGHRNSSVLEEDDVVSIVALLFSLLDDLKFVASAVRLLKLMTLELKRNKATIAITVSDVKLYKLCDLYAVNASVGDVLGNLVAINPALSPAILSRMTSISTKLVSSVVKELEVGDYTSTGAVLNLIRTLDRVELPHLVSALDPLWGFVRSGMPKAARPLVQAFFLAQQFISDAPAPSTLALARELVGQHVVKVEVLLPVLRKCPGLLAMEDKHEFLLSKFPISESEEIRIHRHDILKDSYEELGQRSAEKLKKFQLSVHFRGEEGAGQGLGREWFQVVSQAIVEEQALLFSPVGDCYQPNPSSASRPGHLSYFKFVGRLAAKAIIDSQKLDIRFTRSFYKHILGREVTYMDMEPEVSKSLVWLLENKIEESMGLSFSIDDHSDGRKEMAIHDLIPGGRDVPVTEENKHDYVNHVADYRLTGSIKPQIDAFLDGFYELISKDLISIFDVKELELLMSGPPDVDVEELQKVARCEHTYCILKWFWDAVNGFCKEDKVRLLKFMTGSSKISNTGILITEGGEWNQLPTAYTCSGTIVLPHYQSREQLEEKLLLAIREGCEGFSFV